jgi:hypothetical protein
MTAPSLCPLPALVGMGPGPTTGMHAVLTGDQLVVGRAAECDVRLREAQVGQRHAMVTCHDGQVRVHDLGTPGGTFVNGQPVTAPHLLRRGDVVVFGTVALRYEPGSADVAPPAPGLTAPAVPPPPVAPPPARSRSLGIGALVLVIAFGLLAAGLLGFLSSVPDGVLAPGPGRIDQSVGPQLLGVPSGLLGWATAALGALLLAGGIALHTAAGTRRPPRSVSSPR